MGLILSVDDLCVRAPVGQRGLTKVEVGSIMLLEENPAGFGVNVCTFTDQQLHVGNTPPLDGYVESRLAWKGHTSGHIRRAVTSLHIACKGFHISAVYLCSSCWCRLNPQTF